MIKIIRYFICVTMLLFSVTGYGQAPSLQEPSPAPGLFETDKIIDIILSGNVWDILGDRGDNPQLHPIKVAYKGEDSSEISLPAEGRARGHFRKIPENCYYPPILVQFTKSDALKSSIFKEQDKIKLVMPCKGDDYVVREWLVYKLYNLVTPKSLRARLVRAKLTNAKSNKADPSFYGILLEEEKQMAKRNGAIAVTRKLLPGEVSEQDFLTMTVFEYLIGNTDWSIQYLQNIKLIATDSGAIATAVAYDFDMAGIVNTRYAKPAEELQMNSVRDRRYRGYCIEDMKKFDQSIALFNRIKKDIYSLYNDCTLVDEKYKKSTIQYLDEFYAVINNPDKLKKEFGYPCDKNGTGRVVIKGLKDQ